MARRAKGEGTLRYRTSDKRWEARIPTEDGKLKTFIRKTKADVQRAIAEYRDQEARERAKFRPTEQWTFERFTQKWLEQERDRVAPATYLSRENVVRVHAKALREKLLSEITKDDIHAVLWPSGKGSKKRSSATRAKVRSVLHLIFITALREGYVERNPLELLPPERETRVKEMRALSQEQLNVFFKAAAGHKWEGFFRLALSTGGRPGELLALQWDDVDFERRSVTFRASIGVASADNPRLVRKATTTKTRAAKRTVGVPPEGLELLRKRWKMEGKPKSGLVFYARSRLNGSRVPVGLRNLNRILSQICEDERCVKGDLGRVTLYDFRHTYASHMIMQGEDVLTVAQCLGHTNSKMLLDTYGHVLDRMKKRAAQTAAGILRGALNDGNPEPSYDISMYKGTKRRSA